MKKFTIILATLLASLCNVIYANNPAELNNNGEQERTVVLKSGERARSITDDIIECKYGDGVIEFVLPSDISYLSFELTDDNGSISYSGYITSDNPKANIPHLSGKYKIVCVSDNNVSYTGILLF
jgi:hypothetical protein